MNKARQSQIQKTLKLLSQLKTRNEASDYGGLLAQAVATSEPVRKGVPTLERGVYGELTPMLEARFKYAGAWTNAALSHTWLGIRQMEEARTDKAILNQIMVRKKNWPGSAPEKFPKSRLSLFGIDREEYEETYLVWEDDLTKEPAVYVYPGHEERIFPHLDDYIKYLIA
jgi:hypothetical protein